MDNIIIYKEFLCDIFCRNKVKYKHNKIVKRNYDKIIHTEIIDGGYLFILWCKKKDKRKFITIQDDKFCLYGYIEMDDLYRLYTIWLRKKKLEILNGI